MKIKIEPFFLAHCSGEDNPYLEPSRDHIPPERRRHRLLSVEECRERRADLVKILEKL